MIESGRDLDFAEEPLRTQRRRELGAKHLDRDRTVVLQVPGKVNRGHAPAAEQALDAITVGQSSGERFQWVRGHGPEK
jgi:hypothetical protein